ncbi:MAG: M23 family metallopeptidase [Parasphingorhabdus sp.]|nr:M23 family metallopeptidase [Parasphingorhabdus sp.]
MKILTDRAGLFARLDTLFVDREFFMRSNGQVRFVKFPATLQRRIATVAAAVIGILLLIVIALTVNQFTVSRDRAALSAKAAAVTSSANRVAAYRNSVDAVAEDLSERQDVLESLAKQHFGGEVSAQPGDATEQKLDSNSKKISAAIPEAAALAKLESRQLAFAHRLTAVAEQRIARASAAIRRFGLNPDQLALTSDVATGGPFFPFFNKQPERTLPPALERLDAALNRMSALEQSLQRIPSAMPANAGMMTSSFGYRRDPFTGVAAMHSGIDFKGPYGEPILAAAEGVVSFAGQDSGYGNVVEIAHGNGLMTRYAHLSRIMVRAGQTIDRGGQLGAMGSTGRSTGTHLHFEVRLNGSAINPLPFLEANKNVFKKQTLAEQRADGSTAGG